MLNARPRALSWWRHLLADERLHDLDAFIETLVLGFPMIAALDEGRTLADLGSRLHATHSWWTNNTDSTSVRP